jgi:hypothetical protein
MWKRALVSRRSVRKLKDRFSKSSLDLVNFGSDKKRSWSSIKTVNDGMCDKSDATQASGDFSYKETTVIVINTKEKPEDNISFQFKVRISKHILGI